MLSDNKRVSAYSRALKKHITPDSIVLDLGAGFGAFSVIASKLGAKKVYAVETNNSINLGPEFAKKK